jgi:hypothetical protein
MALSTCGCGDVMNHDGIARNWHGLHAKQTMASGLDRSA